MPLVVAVGMDNCGATFNIAFSYTRTESTTDYRFVLRHIQEIVLKDSTTTGFASSCNKEVQTEEVT
jgi:hypothetical protein